MSTSTYQAERSAAAGYARAGMPVFASVADLALSVTARPWAGTEIVTVSKRHAINPTPRPEEAGP